MTRTLRNDGVLSNLRARLLGFLGLNVALILSAGFGLLAMIAIVADAILALAPGIRIHTPWIFFLVALLILGGSAWAGHRITERRLARQFEQHFPSLGTGLTNAVQLADRSTKSPIEKQFCMEAVKRGQDQARDVAAWGLVRRRVLWWVGMTGIATALWLIGPFLMHDLFAAVLPRFLDPTGDHPPYSRLHIEVELREAAVLYGGQCEIEASVHGAPVEQLHLVSRSPRGQFHTAMFRRSNCSFFQILTNLQTDTEFWVTDGHARSYRHKIHIRYTPQISWVEVNTVYPTYTALRNQTRKLGDSTLHVPKHTTLSFKINSNRPLSGGTIELTPVLGGDKQAVVLTPVAGSNQAVSGRFQVDLAVAFSIWVTDVDGLRSAAPRNGRVTIRPDQHPRVTVIKPSRRAVATPYASIPVVVQAEDDYEVKQIIWYRGFNQSIEQPSPMTWRAEHSPASARAESAFDLRSLGVRPGDRLEYFFEVADNYADGPNVATSAIHSIDIISDEQYAMMLRSITAQRALFEPYMAQNQFMRRLLDQAEALMNSLDQMKGGEVNHDQQVDVAQEATSLATDLAEYERLLGDVLANPTLFEIESSLRTALQTQTQSLGHLRRELDQIMMAMGRDGLLDPNALRRFVKRLTGLTGQMQEQVGDPVEHLASVARLMAQADHFVSLALQQRDLVKLARRFQTEEGGRSRVEQMSMQEIAAPQERVREGLAQFMERVPDLESQIPESNEYDRLREVVARFLQAVQDDDIASDLEAAAMHFRSLDGRSGFAAAQTAYEKMDKLVARCQAMPAVAGQSLCLNFQPTLHRALTNSLQQILSAMSSRGMGSSGGAGYGLFGNSVSVYGPDIPLASTLGRGTGQQSAVGDQPARQVTTAMDPNDPAIPTTTDPLRVRLQRDANFPLRYRKLVGEYFRAVAEAHSHD